MGPLLATASSLEQILSVWLCQGQSSPFQAAQIEPQFVYCNGVSLK